MLSKNRKLDRCRNNNYRGAGLRKWSITNFTVLIKCFLFCVGLQYIKACFIFVLKEIFFFLYPLMNREQQKQEGEKTELHYITAYCMCNKCNLNLKK